MSYTTGALVTQVQNKLDDSQFSSTLIKQFINDAQREVFNTKQLRFMETSTTFSTVAGSDELGTEPTNMQVPIDLCITSPVSYGTKLNFRSYTEVDQWQPISLAVGTPTDWYEFGGNIKLYPTPDQVYTITLRYLKTPTELSADADVPQIPEEFQEILVLGALKRCLEFNDQYDQSAFVDVSMARLIDQMTRRYGPRKSTSPTMMRINKVTN